MVTKTHKKGLPEKVAIEAPKEVEVETPIEVEAETPQEIVVESKKVETIVGDTFENAKITEILWENDVEASVALDNGTTTVINKRI